MQDKYNHLQVEQSVQKEWAERGVYRVIEDSRKKKFYACPMCSLPLG